MVSYNEFEYTHEEFASLVKETASPEALVAVKTIEETYANLKSYRDTGTLNESYDNGNMSTNATFHTAYIAPNRLLFSYKEDPDDFFPTAHKLLMRSEAVTIMASYDDVPETMDDVSLGIAALYGVTSTTSGNIPELLLQGDSLLLSLAHLILLEDKKLKDGTVCLRLRGTDFLGAETTIWISKKDNLVRQIDEKSGKKDKSIITFQPEINIDILDETFTFSGISVDK